MKTVGIACTGGGTKALSDLGVIKALEDLGIKISAISGTSIGSCIAVLYAIGYKTDEILDYMKYYNVEYPKFTFLDKILAPFRLLFRGGGKNPKIIEKTIRDACIKKGKKYMCDIEIPIFIPTLDITFKETIYYSSKAIENEKYFSDRTIWEAVKNSCTLPMLYLPNNVYIDGQLHQFLDGGMTNNTPTIHMNQFVDVVIGIENLYNKKISNKKVNLITGIRTTFQGMRRSAVINQKNASTLWISVDCDDIKIIGDEKDVENCVKSGYNAVMKMYKDGCFNFIFEKETNNLNYEQKSISGPCCLRQ